MRKSCSICGKKEPLVFGSIRLTQIDNVCYCQKCYHEKFAGLQAHPIPDAVFAKGGISNIHVEMPSENEFVFSTSHLCDAKMHIHKLMWYPILGESYESFWGIDHYSGNYVSVLFSEDDTASDGGPSYLHMTAFTPEEFKRVMAHLYARPLRDAFDQVTEKSWKEYLDVHVPIFQAKLGYFLIQNDGDMVKIAKFQYNGMFTYAEVATNVFHQWQSGKTLMEQMDTCKDLSEHPIRYLEHLVPKIMRPCKGLTELFENCFKDSTPAINGSWNLVQIKDFCKEIKLRYISPEHTSALFDFIEKTFSKELSKSTINTKK